MPSAIRRIAAPAATSRSAWPPIWAKELPAADAPEAAEEAEEAEEDARKEAEEAAERERDDD